MKNVVKDSEREPEKIWVDKGSEFYNKHFKEWTNSKNIVIYSTYGESKSTVVERFIRTLKELITPIFTETNSRNWFEILPDVLKTYNNKTHKTIGMSPVEASDPKNAAEVFLSLTPEKSTKKQKITFKVGDNVRISRQKDVFEKDGYNFSYEVFKVDKVLPTELITYKLVDYNGDQIDGSFYSQELLKTETPEYYEIDKILKTRKVGKKKEMYVSFLGWNKKFNTWITEDQIYDIPTK